MFWLKKEPHMSQILLKLWLIVMINWWLNKSDSRYAVVQFCQSLVWLRTELDSTQSCYHYLSYDTFPRAISLENPVKKVPYEGGKRQVIGPKKRVRPF